MYIRELELRRFRLFEQTHVSFANADGSPRMMTVVLAENGQGKTTLLQAIALAASGGVVSNKLALNALSYWDRRYKFPIRPGAHVAELDVCFAKAEFAFAQSGNDARVFPSYGVGAAVPREPIVISQSSVQPDAKQFTSRSHYKDYDADSEWDVDLLEMVRARDLSRWFVAGYGPLRRLPSPLDNGEISHIALDRVSSLFDVQRRLIATGFLDIFTRLFGSSVANEFAAILRNVMVGGGLCPGLFPRDTAMRVENFELRGQGGVRTSTDLVEIERVVFSLGGTEMKLPGQWLSSGYQSVMSLVADVMGWIWYEALATAKTPPAPHEMEGLVLVDEIDLHLHPSWQMSLVEGLRKTFPKLQFVVTTHSPLVLCGARAGEVVRVETRENGSLDAVMTDEDPRVLSIADIFRNFFGVENRLPTEIARLYRDYLSLAGVADRDDVEEAKVTSLFQKLRALGIAVDAPTPRNAGHAAE